MDEPLEDGAILVLTKEGENEIHEAGTRLTPVQLEALVLIDGRSTVAQVLKRAQDKTPGALRSALVELIRQGYVAAKSHDDSDALDPGDFFRSIRSSAQAVEPGHEAEAEAAATLAFLREKGYCVNVVRRREAGPAPAVKRKPVVLVVDDDPGIGSLLQTYLGMEGFETRSAANREEIVAEFRRGPLPDAVLLDVHLPDADGFDILHRMREHPVLGRLPVIMLTGEANREAVLKGILGGADGYITKPFDIHHMVRAVKVVLGMQAGAAGQDWDYSL